MSTRVNLLLLLSALLAALTGAGSAVRAPEQAVVVSRVATAVAARVTAQAGMRPGVALPRIVDMRVMKGAVWSLAPAAPLFLSRRRE